MLIVHSGRINVVKKEKKCILFLGTLLVIGISQMKDYRRTKKVMYQESSIKANTVITLSMQSTSDISYFVPQIIFDHICM